MSEVELTIVPAYGRDYRTERQCLRDWWEGKDFRINTPLSRWDGKYTSIRDLAKFPGQHVKIRYNGMKDFVLIRKDGTIVGGDKDE
jgi:hypothetical protein